MGPHVSCLEKSENQKKNATYTVNQMCAIKGLPPLCHQPLLLGEAIYQEFHAIFFKDDNGNLMELGARQHFGNTCEPYLLQQACAPLGGLLMAE